MAQLSSPGVSVTVIDESFYTPAAPGTVPLIIVASEENKLNSSGTGIAPGTLKANAGVVYLLTSQADLGATFGIPYFQTDASNNPVNAGELNEYGLQAAYSFLGVSSRAFVVRADVNTKQLIGSGDIPHGAPADGTLWWDLPATGFGVFEWDNASASTAGGQSFAVQSVAVTQVFDTNTGAPLKSFGMQGDYAIVVDGNSSTGTLWYKQYNTADRNQPSNGGTWVAVGSPAWSASWPVVSADSAISGYAPNTLSATGDTKISAYVVGGNIIVKNIISGATSVQIGQVYTDGLDSVTIGNPLNGTSTGILTAQTAFSNPLGQANPCAPSGSARTGITQKGVAPAGGTGATFTIQVTGSGTYNVGTNVIITMTAGGHGYNKGDVITIDGAALGGTTITNDLAFVIDGHLQSTYLAVNPSSPTIGSSGSPLTFETPGVSADEFIINGYAITGVTSQDALAAAINAQFDAITATVNSANLLNLYTDGTVDITLTGYTSPQTQQESWHKVGLKPGVYKAIQLQLSPHYSVPQYKKKSQYLNGAPTGSIWVKTTPVNQGAQWIVKKYNAATATFVQQAVSLYSSGTEAISKLDPTGGGSNLALSALYVNYNTTDGVFDIKTRSSVGATTLVSSTITNSSFPTNSYTFTISESIVGSSVLTDPVYVTFSGTGHANDAQALASAIQSAALVNVTASINSNNQLVLSHQLGGEIYLEDTTRHAVTTLFGSSSVTGSNWYSASNNPLFVAQHAAPDTEPADGTLWYDTNIVDVDILVNNGHAWVGRLYDGHSGLSNVAAPDVVAGNAIDPLGPIVSAAAPQYQNDGTTKVQEGDLWVDTSNLENFPSLYRWNNGLKQWIAIDVTDHTTDSGIIFHDARWSGDPADDFQYVEPITKLMTSDYVDGDCLDPALYPQGMLLWNLRRSGFNVKKFHKNYVDPTGFNHRQIDPATGNAEPQDGTGRTYYRNAWVSNAANNTQGVGQFGRKAQRAVVLQGLEALIQGNQQIRDTDSKGFNLLSCPGYLETISSLIALNTDRGQSAFIVADSPARLTPDATTLNNWGNNVAGAAVDGDQGLIATSAYAAVYYPWAYTTDLLGNNIVVPPSHIMLRTISLSDNVSYPWFAPAGVRRGGVTNAASVGYVNGQTGEFHTVALNQGQRDTLAGIHVNPITYLAGTGLVCYGQYTRQLIASSLDRINVARLVIYIRHQLNMLAKPFIFEPNDTITRNEIKQACEKLFLELTGQRALYDYVVVCDTSNNTPARIDRSELHVDIAIEPVKAVEFIYIPMRLENTGAIKTLGLK